MWGTTKSFWRHKPITPNVTTRTDNHEPRMGAYMVHMKGLFLKNDTSTLSGNLSNDNKWLSLPILNKSHVGHNEVISETQAHHPQCHHKGT